MLQWPVLEAIKVIGGASGHGIERFEVLFITVWMVAAFTTAGAVAYTGIRLLSDATGWRDNALTTMVILPLMYVLCLAPENLFQVKQAAGLAGKVAVGYGALISVILYAVAILKGQRGDAGGGGPRSGTP